MHFFPRQIKKKESSIYMFWYFSHFWRESSTSSSSGLLSPHLKPNLFPRALEIYQPSYKKKGFAITTPITNIVAAVPVFNASSPNRMLSSLRKSLSNQMLKCRCRVGVVVDVAVVVVLIVLIVCAFAVVHVEVVIVLPRS